MKAWLVREKDEFCCIIVFAPTRGKAKTAAINEDVFDDAEYIFLEATRYPKADSMYNGSTEPYALRWEDQDDRLFLVKECGWQCEEMELEHCENCKAKDYCGEYQQWLDDNEDSEP